MLFSIAALLEVRVDVGLLQLSPIYIAGETRLGMVLHLQMDLRSCMPLLDKFP